MCTCTDVLQPNTSYPVITVTVNVKPNASSPQVNAVAVSGGGSANANTTDSTVISANPPVLSIVKTHNGSFTQNQQGATSTVTVSDAADAGPTDGTTVTVTETVPSGLTLVSMAGTGWTCPANGTTCTRSDVLQPNSSYPVITVTVNVFPITIPPQPKSTPLPCATPSRSNTTDSTVISANPPVLSITKTHNGS